MSAFTMRKLLHGGACAAALGAFLAANAARGASLATLTNRYNLNIKDEASGVYEWAEEGLLFVQVRLAEASGDAAEEMDAQILAEEHRLLFEWLAAQATAERKDPPLPQGMERLRALVRAHMPTWEYDADWNYNLKGPHFSRHEIGERVCCAVYEKDKVLATMPPSFKKSAPPEIWLRGAKELFSSRAQTLASRPFLWEAGLVDLLALSLDDGASPAGWVREFGDAAAAHWKEYTAVESELAAYMENSATAKAMAAEKLRLETLPDEITYEWGAVKPKIEKTQTTETTTNAIDGALFEVVSTTKTTERVTRLLRKVVTPRAVDPRFEKLFLSAGAMANAAAPRTAKGREAEAAFLAKSALLPAQRERALVEALRENPGDKALWNLLGRAMSARGDTLGALACLRNALRLDAAYDYALANLAGIYDRLGRHALAQSAAIAAYALADNDWCRKEALRILEK